MLFERLPTVDQMNLAIVDFEPPTQSVNLVIQRQLVESVLGFATLLADVDDLRFKWYAVCSVIVGNREHVGSDTIDGNYSGHLQDTILACLGTCI